MKVTQDTPTFKTYTMKVESAAEHEALMVALKVVSTVFSHGDTRGMVCPTTASFCANIRRLITQPAG